ncbi:MAG: hydrogen peroxide-inducible genes activator [Betaproteobacteria bacterium]|jgi:LysR family hydrogen peroxide-inducible transcriptional activator
MTLTELRYIIAVAREKHFGRAAEACFVSQPTLSVSIKKLESELGVIIFERGGSEITLTPIGENIVQQAQRVLDAANQIKEIADQGRDPLRGALRLGVIYTIGPYLLPRIIKSMIERYPDMPLILQENFTVRLVEMMRTGEIDVAILADPFDTTGLDTMPLYDEDFVVAVPKKHHWTKKQQIASVDLKQETMLLLGVGHCFRDQVLEVCPEAARFAANSAGIQKTFEGSSLETIRHMVAEGLGITVLPRMSVSLDDDPLLKFITFAPPVPNRRIVLAWRKSFSRDRAVDALHEVIHSVELPGCKKL